jgi:hypothetical protein
MMKLDTESDQAKKLIERLNIWLIRERWKKAIRLTRINLVWCWYLARIKARPFMAVKLQAMARRVAAAKVYRKIRLRKNFLKSLRLRLFCCVTFLHQFDRVHEQKLKEEEEREAMRELERKRVESLKEHADELMKAAASDTVKLPTATSKIISLLQLVQDQKKMGSRVSKAIQQVTAEVLQATSSGQRETIFTDCALCEAPRILINVLNLHPKDEDGQIFKSVMKCLSVLTVDRSLAEIAMKQHFMLKRSMQEMSLAEKDWLSFLGHCCKHTPEDIVRRGIVKSPFLEKLRSVGKGVLKGNDAKTVEMVLTALLDVTNKLGHEVITSAESRSLSLSENTQSDRGIMDLLTGLLTPDNAEAVLVPTLGLIANFSSSQVMKGSEFMVFQKTIAILQAHPTKHAMVRTAAKLLTQVSNGNAQAVMDNLKKTDLPETEVLYLLSLSNQNRGFLATGHLDPLIEAVASAAGQDLDDARATTVETSAKALANICTTMDSVRVVVKKNVIEACCGILSRDTVHEGLHNALLACLRHLLVCRQFAQLFVNAGGLTGVKKILAHVAQKMSSIKRTSVKNAQEALSHVTEDYCMETLLFMQTFLTHCSGGVFAADLHALDLSSALLRLCRRPCSAGIQQMAIQTLHELLECVPQDGARMAEQNLSFQLCETIADNARDFDTSHVQHGLAVVQSLVNHAEQQEETIDAIVRMVSANPPWVLYTPDASSCALIGQILEQIGDKKPDAINLPSLLEFLQRASGASASGDDGDLVENVDTIATLCLSERFGRKLALDHDGVKILTSVLETFATMKDEHLAKYSNLEAIICGLCKAVDHLLSVSLEPILAKIEAAGGAAGVELPYAELVFLIQGCASIVSAFPQMWMPAVFALRAMNIVAKIAPPVVILQVLKYPY